MAITKYLTIVCVHIDQVVSLHNYSLRFSCALCLAMFGIAYCGIEFKLILRQQNIKQNDYDTKYVSNSNSS